MVFGLFEGSIELRLNKTNFFFGETIEGTLALKLKKPKDARQLRVSIVAERETTQYSGGKRSTRIDTIFKSDNVVDGEKTYLPPGGEYPFKVQLPASSAIPQAPQFESAVGTAIKVVQALSMQNTRMKWFVDASLDIPKGIDINKKVQITVQ
ncbi:MAG: hypothetical protein NTW59_02270 [Candidatus Diapherotrites archaeon]|nr:hypothetical protein [Candidatus Diapherotrites archaeon]